MRTSLVAVAGGADPGTATVVAAVVAAVVALLVSVLTQAATQIREGRARDYLRRRQAALDVQDAAVVLRGRVRDYGRAVRASSGLPSPDLDRAEAAFDDARSAFDVSVTRIERRELVPKARGWVVDAQRRYVSTQDTGVAEEQASWDAMQESLGTILRSKRG